jgi:multidrug efflux system outer membrane protein
MRRLLPVLILVGGCSLEPKYVAPIPAIPASWPIHDARLLASETGLARLAHDEVFLDPRLRQLIAQSLANNQDVRLALANIEAARGLYQVQRSAQLPTVNGTGSASLRAQPFGSNNSISNLNGTGTSNGAGTGTTTTTNNSSNRTLSAYYSADVGASAFEIDLFGRVRSLSNAALNSFFATEAAARATRLTLVGDVASAWFTYANDRSLVRISEQTVAAARQSERLTKLRLDGGVAPRTDLRQAQTVRATAEADLANLTALVEQDRNALVLLASGPVTDAQLPASIEEAEASTAVPAAGLDSSILLRRPDVVEAEFRLRSDNASIGAARAAFFPRISLTGIAGLASGGLTSLLSGKAFSAMLAPSVSIPIFGGTNRGNLAFARAEREGAVASYEKALQAAFRDVANALARRATIDRQVAADEELVAAAQDTARLTDARYRGGIDTYLTTLDAQRSLYAARRTLAAARLARAQSVVALYTALGGDATL